MAIQIPGYTDPPPPIQIPGYSDPPPPITVLGDNADRPNQQKFELRIPSAGLTITNWISYSYDSHFLTPSDGFHFQIEDDTRIETIKNAAVPGAMVTLAFNGLVQCTGYIDSVDIQNSRDGGTTLAIHGRDLLAQVVDGCADPSMQFAPNQPLEQILKAILKPFGLGLIIGDNDANRSLITGAKFSLPVSKKKHHPLQQAVKHQLAPYPREGAFAFLARIAQRFGLWTWLFADGTSVVVGQPNFDTQNPLYKLERKRSGGGQFNNVLSGGIKIDFSEQPDVVVAEGVVGGVEWGHARMRYLAFNPLTAVDQYGLDLPEMTALRDEKFPDAKVIGMPQFPQSLRVLKREELPNGKAPPPRIMYLHDDEAKTPDELAAFVRRETALKMRHAVVGHYTVEGHTQGGIPWCVDSVVDVDDEVAGFKGPMWILSRVFEKSRHAGTRTHLELLLPNVLTF